MRMAWLVFLPLSVLADEALAEPLLAAAQQLLLQRGEEVLGVVLLDAVAVQIPRSRSRSGKCGGCP